MPRVKLAANLESRDGTLTKGALITNGFMEGEKEEVSRVFKRGGLALVTSLGSSIGQGMVNYFDSGGVEVLFAVQNGTLVLSDIPPAGGAWVNSLTGVDNYASYISFGGFLWSVANKQTAYKATPTAVSWTVTNSNSWSSVDSNNRNQGCLAVLGTTMYYVGPSVGGSGVGSKEVWQTLDGATWTRITAAAAFTANASPRVLVLNNRMYYLGGISNNDIYSSTDGITWTLVNNAVSYGTNRIAFGAVVQGGKMWIAGGSIVGVAQNDVWSSPDGVTWTQTTAAAAWAICYAPVLINANNVLYLFGGKAAGSGIDQIYSSLDGITWTAVSHSGFASGVWGAIDPQVYATMGLLFNDQVLIFGSLSVLYTSSTTTSAATIGTVNGGFFDFAKNLDGTQIMAKSKNSAFKLTPATNALTSISDAQYPAVTTRGCVYLDGTFYVMTPEGRIQGSDLEDCSSWQSDNIITAEFEPDSGVCLSKYNNYVVALGQWTTQMFFDNKNPNGSPLSPVANGVLLIGCAHENSAAQIESTVIWMAQRKGQGSTFQKGRFIAMLEGQSYVEVSNPDVNRVLDADDLATVYATVGTGGGHNFYILALGTTGVSLVYDLTTKHWYVWTQTTAGTAVSVSSLTQTLGVATATTGTAHGFSDGDPVTIAGATPAGYNQTFINVTVTGATTFTYPVSSSLSTPATGTITATSVTESYMQVVASCNYRSEQVFQAASGGNVYALRDTTYQDNSLPINFKVRSKRNDFNTINAKFCSDVTLVGDTISDTGLLRYSDNDYQTNSYYRRFDLSSDRVQNQRYGRFRRRSWEVRYTGTLGYRIEALEVDINAQEGGMKGKDDAG